MINNKSGFIDTDIILSALNYISAFFSELSPEYQNTRMTFMMKTSMILQVRES